ncbi:hypothetical protein JAAARDRAFT_200821 [Jaapia argillacea MUCL 33604]|uniref:DUF6533 domain-containing protein n=1 Tax=Jaapia argillacea MUCL 33604 TaxID=933084 RepID=A0A067P3K4_9AGAM|nr:hypothetical protein JAAARDRAFT_200821 [Jaapia argillacea MUCL 33604]
MPGFSEPVFVGYLHITRMGQLSATLAALYDYAISIDQEVELIWGHPGHTAKIFYFLMRYCGNAVVVTIFVLLITGINSDNAYVELSAMLPYH